MALPLSSVSLLPHPCSMADNTGFPMVAPHQADVVLWPQQLYHEVQVLPLCLFLGPLPIVWLVTVERFLTRGFLHWLRAILRCITTVPSVLQSQDSSTEHRKALPGRVMGSLGPWGSQVLGSS